MTRIDYVAARKRLASNVGSPLHSRPATEPQRMHVHDPRRKFDLFAVPARSGPLLPTFERVLERSQKRLEADRGPIITLKLGEFSLVITTYS